LGRGVHETGEPAAPEKAAESGLGSGVVRSPSAAAGRLFRHVNGSWLTKTEIPADKASYGAFDILVRQGARPTFGHRRRSVEVVRKDRRSRSAEDRRLSTKLHERAARRELGITPLKAELDAIDAIKTKSDLGPHFARFFKLNLINPIVGYVDGDAQQPTNDILYVFQGGLGLPDRDYYIKNDDKLKEYREKYVGFVGNILGQAGDANAASPRAKSSCSKRGWRGRIGPTSRTAMRSRPTTRSRSPILAKQFPGFDWDTWTKSWASTTSRRSWSTSQAT
jgi:predicted metalloendopeptidase